MSHRFKFSLVAAAAAFAVSGCGGGEPSAVPALAPVSQETTPILADDSLAPDPANDLTTPATPVDQNNWVDPANQADPANHADPANQSDTGQADPANQADPMGQGNVEPESTTHIGEDDATAESSSGLSPEDKEAIAELVEAYWTFPLDTAVEGQIVPVDLVVVDNLDHDYITFLTGATDLGIASRLEPGATVLLDGVMADPGGDSGTVYFCLTVTHTLYEPVSGQVADVEHFHQRVGERVVRDGDRWLIDAPRPFIFNVVDDCDS